MKKKMLLQKCEYQKRKTNCYSTILWKTKKIDHKVKDLKYVKKKMDCIKLCRRMKKYILYIISYIRHKGFCPSVPPSLRPFGPSLTLTWMLKVLDCRFPSKDFRPSRICPSRSRYPPWIMKRAWRESSGWRLNSTIGKTKIIAFFCFGKKKYF